jgi:predicted small secreted protein
MSKHTLAAAVRLTLAAGVAAAALALSGCNTVKGVGSDIQGAGQATEDAIKGK